MRQFDIREPSIDALRVAPVYFRYGSNKRRTFVDALTASAVLTCYDKGDLSDANKEKFARMVAGTPAQFRRIVNFCWKHVKIGS
jgi:hypothetical protein